MTPYEKVRAAIVKAVPEIVQVGEFYGEPIEHERPITLEDVLRAIEQTGKMAELHGDGTLRVFHNDFDDAPGQNKLLLGKPLSEQSPETIDFLAGVLCPLEHAGKR